MEGVDPFDPKLMEEILKYNEKASKPKAPLKQQGKLVKQPNEQEGDSLFTHSRQLSN